jgi:hypothetical protein
MIEPWVDNLLLALIGAVTAFAGYLSYMLFRLRDVEKRDADSR